MSGSVIAALALVLAAPGWAQPTQNPGRIMSAGYSAPSPLKAAPGQVITLFVHSTAETQPAGKVTAGAFPLPVLLGGYSVSLEQTLFPNPIAVPIFAVEALDSCYGLVPSVCLKLTAITIQVPWELVPNRPRSGRPENFGILTVSYQGTRGDAFPLQPEVDSIHVISTCDSPTPPGVDRPSETTGPCRPLVTHLDGALVTPANPALAGEVVRLYAFGLGRSEGILHTGDLVQSPVAFPDLAAGFQIGVNLDPTRPAADSSDLVVTASLIAGQVGIYQVLVTIPEIPEDTQACTASRIVSNLTLSIGRQQSFAGAGICVQP